jgi:hypothetical protein
LLLEGLRFLLSKYRQTHQHPDLVFSPLFNTQQCEILRQEATRQGLSVDNAWSYKKKKKTERYVIISHRRTPLEIVEHVRYHKGQTVRYILQEPPGHDNFVILAVLD